MAGVESNCSTNVPVDLLMWITKDGIIKASVLKTYLYLKMTRGGRAVKAESLYSDIAEGLDIHVKTVRSHIGELIRVKFLGLDKNTNILYVRSKYRIIPKKKRVSKYSVKISLTNLKYFTEYLVAAVVAYMVTNRMAKHKKALINDGAQRRLCQLNRKYHIGIPLSLSYIAKFLGKSISWVDKYKQKAKNLKLLKAGRNWLPTAVNWQNRGNYMSTYDISLGRAKKYRGKLYLVDSDLLQSNVMVIKRKKSV